MGALLGIGKLIGSIAGPLVGGKLMGGGAKKSAAPVATPASSGATPPTPLPIRAGGMPEYKNQNLTRMRSIYGAE